MDSFYYSFFCRTEEPLSPFQVHVWGYRRQNERIIKAGSEDSKHQSLIELSGEQLERYFWERFRTFRESRLVPSFLEYQFEMFQGDKDDFLNHLDRTYKRVAEIYLWVKDKREELTKSENKLRSEPLTTQQRILLLRYLEKHGFFSFKKLAQADLNQANLLGALFGRSNDKIRSILRKKDYELKKEENLKAVLAVVKENKTEFDEVIDEIANDLALFK